MVSKLVEAVGELVDESLDSGDSDYSRELAQHFHRLKDGIGVHKSPVDYGAIPTDPYSHTPGNKGVQQPGMTGQVKEDILSRYLELGVQYEDGKISFSRGFFNENEFLTTAEEVDYLALTGDWQTAAVNKNAIFFTLCQVPVFYEKAGNEGLVIEYSDGNNEEIAGNSLPANITSEIFNRTNKIRRVTYRISR